MPSFENKISEIIVKSGFEGAVRINLAADASTRTYERLELNGKSAILMKAPPGNENPPCPINADIEARIALGWNATSRLAASRVEAFVAIADFLETNGFKAPKIYAEDYETGLAVIEDLGNNLYADLLKEFPEKEDELYTAAGKLLAKLHALEVPKTIPSPNGEWPILEFDRLALEVNADLFIDWVPQYLGIASFSDETILEWQSLRDEIIDEILTHKRVLTLRDYHAENMLWLDGQIGLLDFQDAVLGFRAWDFSMLLHDARRDVSKSAYNSAINAYCDETGAKKEELEKEIALEGAINTLRIIGIFSRLIKRDGKEKYRAFMPREIGHLEEILEHPKLAKLKAFIMQNAPIESLRNS